MFGELHEHRKNLINLFSTRSGLCTSTGRSTAIAVAIVFVVPWARAATICSWTDVTAWAVSPHWAPAALPWYRAPAAIRGGAPGPPFGRWRAPARAATITGALHRAATVTGALHRAATVTGAPPWAATVTRAPGSPFIPPWRNRAAVAPTAAPAVAPITNPSTARGRRSGVTFSTL